MSNMSYCRFQNTVGDFRDCTDKLEEMQNDPSSSKLSREELDAAKILVSAARDLIEQIAEFSDVEIEDLNDKNIEDALDKLQAQSGKSEDDEDEG